MLAGWAGEAELADSLSQPQGKFVLETNGLWELAQVAFTCLGLHTSILLSDEYGRPWEEHVLGQALCALEAVSTPWRPMA